MLKRLKEEVLEANLELHRRGLVVETFGNVSGVDRDSGLVVIKPSGVPYGRMRAADMCVVSLAEGRCAAGSRRPSSDTPTHLELYRAFARIGGVAHTHSFHVTAWAQARRGIPPLGTTHADCFRGEVPCTRALTSREIARDYEANTGEVIVERFAGIDPMEMPAVLVSSHGPFTWGASPDEAVHNAAMLEYVAQVALATMQLAPAARPISAAMLDKHFLRKHGAGSYYGQKPARRR